MSCDASIPHQGDCVKGSVSRGLCQGVCCGAPCGHVGPGSRRFAMWVVAG